MKIKDTPTKKLKAIVADEVSRAYKVAGYNITNMEDTVNLMCETLVKQFGENTTEDVVTAFRMGALGNYGDYAGISVRTLYSWMRTFNGNAVNRVAEIEPEAPVVDEAPRDKAQDGRNLVNACYETFCQKGCFFVPASLLLRILKDNGMVVTDDDVASAQIQAESNLSTEFMRNRQRFMKLKDYITRNIDNEAEGVLVKNYFTECMKKGMKTIF